MNYYRGVDTVQQLEQLLYICKIIQIFFKNRKIQLQIWNKIYLKIKVTRHKSIYL